jgi:predicted acylesterase/phospholipase RssA
MISKSGAFGGPNGEWEKSSEVRCGLVLFGGVSLAIYINGVSREFFDAVRGRGVYKLLKALCDCDIVVDVISGTSAGGINGILLSYALLNGGEFRTTAELWRDMADIGQLIRKPREATTNSLLDSSGYQAKLERGLETLTSGSPRSSRASDDPSPISELDLFITSTRLDPNVFTVFDDAGHAVDVKDHRQVFRLKHREGRTGDLTGGGPIYNHDVQLTHRALATLARATSAFPAAFEPVALDGDAEVGALLRRWGKLEGESNKLYFVDGGVLDNKPFSHTVRAIFERPATRDVDRIVYYVEPDPEAFAKDGSQPGAQDHVAGNAARKANGPTFLRTAVEGAYGIKSYESIADDLQVINEHNVRVERYQRLSVALRGASLRKDQGVVPFGPGLLSDPQYRVYLRSRLQAICDRSIVGLLRVDGQDRHLQGKTAREAASRLAKTFDELHTDESEMLRTLQDLDVYFRLRRLYHVAYRVKEALYDREQFRLEFSDEDSGGATLSISGITDTVRLEGMASDVRDRINALNSGCVARVLDAGPTRVVGLSVCRQREVAVSESRGVRLVPCPPSAVQQELWRRINGRIQLLELTQHCMEYAIDHIEVDWQHERRPVDVWTEVQAVFRAIIDQSGLPDVRHTPLSPADLTAMFEALKARTSTVTPTEAAALSPTSVLLATDEGEALMFNDFPKEEIREFLAEYDEFINLDAVLYPLQFLAGLSEKDVLKIVRISPADAQRAFSAQACSRKLAGDSVAHFGGFFKRSWRANDLLWGRLDGMCELIECVVTPGRLTRLFSRPYVRARVRARFVSSEGHRVPAISLEELFPHAGAVTRQRCLDWIEALVSEDEQTRRRALDEDEIEEQTERLVEMAQLETLHAEVPEVVRAALAEQDEWNRYSVEPGTQLSPREIQKRARRLRVDATDVEGSLLVICRQIALWTGGDETAIDRYCRLAQEFDAKAWDSAPAVGQPTLGEGIVRRAAATSRALYDVGGATFTGPIERLDPVVGAVAAEAYAELGLSVLRRPEAASTPPMETRLGRFFKDAYRVGREDVLRHIPTGVLAETVLRAMLVLRTCLLSGLEPEIRERIESHTVYRWGFDRPLRLAHAVSGRINREPLTSLLLQAILLAAAAATLAVTAARADTVVFVNGRLSLRWLFLLVVLPASAIVLTLRSGLRAFIWLFPLVLVLLTLLSVQAYTRNELPSRVLYALAAAVAVLAFAGGLYVGRNWRRLFATSA